jgi:hypothetical protein
LLLTGSPTSRQSRTASEKTRKLAHLSFEFVLDVASHGALGLKPLEALLMMAVNQANIAPLTRDPAARSRYGALEAPAPDEERRPVSVRAVAASMRLPYETARRNIRKLQALGVCVTSEAGVVTPESYMRSEAYLDAARRSHERLLALYLELRGRGLLDPLPAANYAERDPPVRAAVRLMSDYLLRAADALVARVGDLIGGFTLLPLLAAAAAGDTDGLGVAALARRVQLPPETVRRRGGALVEAGLCRKAGGRIALSDPDFSTPLWTGLLVDNAIAAQRMFAGLAERGVTDAWDRLADATSRSEEIV